jgi:tetratricopeptide (TPR) repeat protein
MFLYVLLHELGHAIPVLIFTRKPISIFLGSYGDKVHSVNLKIGLLKIWFNKNPIKLYRSGVCIPEKRPDKYYQNLIFIAFGSIFPVIIAAALCYTAYHLGVNHFLKTSSLTLFLLTVYGLYNLWPNKKTLNIAGGNITYKDGYLLATLIRYRKFGTQYIRALNLYHAKDYAAAAIIFQQIASLPKDNSLYRHTFASYFQARDYERAKEILDIQIKKFPMDANDNVNAAALYIMKNECEKALEHLNIALESDPRNLHALYNKGYVLNLLDKYTEALPYFDQALQINPFAAVYANRALAKFKTGSIEEGLKDVEQALKMDISNAYAHRNLGVYNFDKGEYKTALKEFEIAKELDKDTRQIDELITLANSKLQELN